MDERNARFSFVDFIDDEEVVDTLLALLKNGRAREEWKNTWSAGIYRS